jgi:hypothetical protein
VLVAIGVAQSGYREILAVSEGAKEDKASWTSFLPADARHQFTRTSTRRPRVNRTAERVILFKTADQIRDSASSFSCAGA